MNPVYIYLYIFLRTKDGRDKLRKLKFGIIMECNYFRFMYILHEFLPCYSFKFLEINKKKKKFVGYLGWDGRSS